MKSCKTNPQLVWGKKILITLLVGFLLQFASSIPVHQHSATVSISTYTSTEISTTASSNSSETVSNGTETSAFERSNSVDHSDYIISENEYELLLARLRDEAENSIVHDRSNYVQDDLSDEEIANLIDAREKQGLNEDVTSESSNVALSSVEPGSASTDDENLCSICLEEMNSGSNVKRLRCDHEFHSSCIDTWSRQYRSHCQVPECPLCRKKYNNK